VQCANPLASELRPRRGSSAWRALYRRIGNSFVIGAILPEAQTDPRGFAKGITIAEQRLVEIAED
jgi:hypothetical protein